MTTVEEFCQVLALAGVGTESFIQLSSFISVFNDPGSAYDLYIELTDCGFLEADVLERDGFRIGLIYSNIKTAEHARLFFEAVCHYYGKGELVRFRRYRLEIG